MDLNQSKEERFTDEEMSEVDRLQSDPSSEYYYNDPDNEESFLDKVKRKLAPYGEDFKGFVEYLFTPSRHFGTGQYNEGGVAEQMEMFGYTAEGAQQEADKFVEEAGNLEEDISKAASFVVPFYDSGVNISNVVQEYMKPEQERDYDYIKSQFTEAGQSAAIEGGLLLMGGVAGKYGAKGIKALADKVKQYEIDPTAMSAFGAGAIRKKPTIKESVPTIDAAGLTDEAIETWRKKNATSPEFRKALKGRDKELMDLAAGVKEGRVFNTTYRKRADELRPIRKVKDVPKPSTVKEIVSALDSGKRKSPIVGLNYDIPDGEVITARLDIPAYVDYDTWIPTLRHASKTMYKSALRMKNVKFIQPEGREVGSALDVAVGPQRLEETFGLTKKKAQAKGNKSPFAVMEGSYVDGTDDELFTMAKEVFDSDEWTQVGYDPVKRGFFYDRETKQAILEADEVIQVGHLVLAKNAKKTDPDVFSFNEGGAVMDDQMQMAFMNEGGIADDGMDVDPVSGNEVPPGSLAEEVRDDIPAQLSEGEYVVPADVVRYYGVKFFEDLRDQAKMGLADMEANGRIGGEPVPAGGPINDEELSPQEMQAIQEMMGMSEGGAIQNPYLQQQQMYNQPSSQAVGNTIGYSGGGQVQGYQPGGPVSTPVSSQPEAPSYARNPFDASKFGLGYSFMGGQQQQPPVADTPAIPEIMTLYGPNGEIRTFNLPLSEADAAEVARLKEMGYSETKAVTPTTTTTGGDDPVSKTSVETDPNAWMKDYDYNDINKLASQTSDMLDTSPKGSVMGAFMNAQKAAQAAGHIIIMKNNGATEEQLSEAQTKYNKFITDSKLGYLPKGLVNGDRIAKDIVLNNPGKDIALDRNSVDVNNKPLFKDDNDFNKFMQKTAPKGMTFDPDAKYKTTDDSGKSVEVGSFKREGSAAPTKSLRPIGRPDNLVKPVYYEDEFGKVKMGYESATPKKPSSKPSKPKTQKQKDSDAKAAISGWVSATNATKGKKGIARHKAIKAQSDASRKATKAIREASGYNKKNEGGLMNKKGNK
tara:strand:+ start:413 stop:3529 length:3117 start_codon:yes stop_codon:yes gene_type:complete